MGDKIKPGRRKYRICDLFWSLESNPCQSLRGALDMRGKGQNRTGEKSRGEERVPIVEVAT